MRENGKTDGKNWMVAMIFFLFLFFLFFRWAFPSHSNFYQSQCSCTAIHDLRESIEVERGVEPSQRTVTVDRTWLGDGATNIFILSMIVPNMLLGKCQPEEIMNHIWICLFPVPWQGAGVVLTSQHKNSFFFHFFFHLENLSFQWRKKILKIFHLSDVC